MGKPRLGEAEPPREKVQCGGEGGNYGSSSNNTRGRSNSQYFKSVEAGVLREDLMNST